MDYSTFKNELFKYLNVEIFEANDRIYFELDPQYSYRNKELFVFDNEEFEELLYHDINKKKIIFWSLIKILKFFYQPMMYGVPQDIHINL